MKNRAETQIRATTDIPSNYRFYYEMNSTPYISCVPLNN